MRCAPITARSRRKCQLRVEPAHSHGRQVLRLTGEAERRAAGEPLLQRDLRQVFVARRGASDLQGDARTRGGIGRMV